jgi:hypothetical protein
LLSHIKAPLREEKREVASYPEQNLTRFAVEYKRIYQMAIKTWLQLQQIASKHSPPTKRKADKRERKASR